MFRVKICGITNPGDALAAATCGADAIGINFYPLSARYVEPVLAREMVRALPESVAAVGVFVNAEADFINDLARQLTFDYVQLHGDETPDLAARLESPIIRAWRFGGDLAPILSWHAAADRQGARVKAILLDAYRPNVYGGSGAIADWDAIRAAAAFLPPLPLILAGGLTPENVATAIATARPWAVDVASGVELPDDKRRKDQLSMASFVRAARAEFERESIERQGP